MCLLQQGLQSLQSIGQDVAIRGNPQLTTLAGLTALKTVGTVRGSDIWIEDNPKLADLAGLEGATIYGTVNAARNGPIPEASITALQTKVQAVPITIETLVNGLPSNVSKPAAPAAGK
jgi:hypothetical protein